MKNRYPLYTCLLALSLQMMAGCATDPDRVEQRQKGYENQTRLNQKFAKDWRNSGNDDMSAFYEQEAQKARHNRDAAGCDATSQFIFTVLLGSDACEIK